MSHNDPVGHVAGRLQEKLSATILEKARSELRGLQFQNPHGTFGKGDNDLKRASVLLEYVAREEQGVKIPLGHLAKAAYVKEADFGKFHRQIGNFRNRPTTSSSDTITSTIPSLAMKLGSHVNDSNGVAIRAQRLLNRIVRFHYKNPHQLRDIGRFAKVYEAVCFFIEATHHAHKDEGDEGKQLQVATVVDVSTDFTLSEFANILEHVQSMIETMNEATEGKESTKESSTDCKTASKKRKGPINPTNDRSQPSDIVGRSTKTSRSAGIIEEIKERVECMELLNDDLFGHRVAPTDTFIVPHFLQWKQQVLDQAIQCATMTYETDQQAANITRLQALEKAVQNVLESCGMILLK